MPGCVWGEGGKTNWTVPPAVGRLLQQAAVHLLLEGSAADTLARVGNRPGRERRRSLLASSVQRNVWCFCDEPIQKHTPPSPSDPSGWVHAALPSQPPPRAMWSPLPPISCKVQAQWLPARGAGPRQAVRERWARSMERARQHLSQHHRPPPFHHHQVGRWCESGSPVSQAAPRQRGGSAQ